MTTYIYLSDKEKAQIFSHIQQKNISAEEFVRRAIGAYLSTEQALSLGNLDSSKERALEAMPTQPLAAVRPLLPSRGVLAILRMVACEVLYLVVASIICNFAYWYLAAWPVYRVVAVVVVLIVWSNCASAVARDKTKEQALRLFSQMSSHATTLLREKQHAHVKAEESKLHPALSQDTTGYLAALKLTLRKGHAHVVVSETPCLYAAVHADSQYCALVDPAQSPSD